MKTAILVLSSRGLAMARRLRATRPGATAIFGPSCVVGVCGGPVDAMDGKPGRLLPGTFATGELNVFGWTGPLRLVFPAIWGRFDAIVAVMAMGIVVRLSGPLAVDKRRDPAVVVVDDTGRFAISVIDGHGARADELAEHVAAILGAQAVVTTRSGSRWVDAASQTQRAGYDGGEGGPNPGA